MEKLWKSVEAGELRPCAGHCFPMGEVKRMPAKRRVLTPRLMHYYEIMGEGVERHLRLQKEWEDELLGMLAQGWVVSPESELEFEFGEKVAVVSRIRVVRRKGKA